MIRWKFVYILGIKKPDSIEKELKNWDLWGPFVICLLLSLYPDDLLEPSTGCRAGPSSPYSPPCSSLLPSARSLSP
jgi:hypothetical protein